MKTMLQRFPHLAAIIKLSTATLLSAILAACHNTWVQLTPEGSGVSLATAAETTSCERIGTATVNALDNIAFINRGATPVQDELVTLARNEGGRLGGNRVVPESAIDDGHQTFGVFRC